MSVLTAATPTSAWIGGTAETASPYKVTWKDSSTSLISGYTNWAAITNLASTYVETVMGSTGTWTADRDNSATKHSLMCQVKPS